MKNMNICCLLSELRGRILLLLPIKALAGDVKRRLPDDFSSRQAKGQVCKKKRWEHESKPMPKREKVSRRM
jgi:hypothetical protein